MNYFHDNSNIAQLIISIGIAQGVGIGSSFFAMNTREQYFNLVQPSFAPPGWVFGVAWTILYTLMGIASYRIYSLGFADFLVKTALFFYAAQLAVNFFWTIIFFRLELRGFAFIWLIFLWILIAITVVKFYNLDKIAGYLMIPYIIWVGFAGLLNYSIWKLNN
jgi:translocator protein